MVRVDTGSIWMGEGRGSRPNGATPGARQGPSAPWDNDAVTFLGVRSWRLPHRLRRGALWALAILSALLLSCGWAMSSPVGASPDEVHHVVYAWGSATGQTLPGRAKETWRDNGAALTSIIVPGNMLESLDRSCYAFKPTEPACAIDPGEGAGVYRLTSSSMTRYPPLYYLGTGLVMRGAMALGSNAVVAIIAARVFSGMVSLMAVGLAAVCLGRRFGAQQTLVVLALTMTPQFLFLSASVNPNGFEIAFAFAQAACVVALIHEVGAGRKAGAPLAAGLCATTLCLGLARPASIVWALAATLLLLVPFTGRPALAGLARGWRVAFCACLAVGIGWFVYLNALRQGGVTDHDVSTWEGYSFSLRSLLVVLKFGDIVESGYSLLGWADTKMPRFFLIAWLVVGAAALARLSSGGRPPVMRQRWAFTYLAVCAGATAVQSFMAGFGWQGRYFMPCVAAFTVLLLPGMSAGAQPDHDLRTTNTALLVLVTTWLLDTGAVMLNLGRYLYGYSDLYKLFEQLPVPTPVVAWQPVISRFGPVYLAVVGGTVLFLIGCLLSRRRRTGDAIVIGRTGGREEISSATEWDPPVPSPGAAGGPPGGSTS